MKKELLTMAIHDISGIGRSSLTVIIPTMSVMGVQVCPVPTAVFSTHLGGLGEVVSRDLTEYLLPALQHYKSLNFDVDSVYTGFLASSKQIDICKAYFDAYPNSLKLVDPVMGDDGKAYQTIDKKLQNKMRELVSKADIITPNLTEACLLLDIEYKETTPSLNACKKIIKSLAELGAKEIVLKGLLFQPGEITNLVYNKAENDFFRVDAKKIPESYPGTGDIFASVYLSALLKGLSSQQALEKSSKFLEYAVRYTYNLKSDIRYGIALENCLGQLL